MIYSVNYAFLQHVGLTLMLNIDRSAEYPNIVSKTSFDSFPDPEMADELSIKAASQVSRHGGVCSVSFGESLHL